MYLDGMSSSLPEDVQYKMVHSVKGLENAKIVRPAYAIEYDCISATDLKPSLEFKNVEGLFSAGQLNGSSGYEEAGAQGLMAGINAARELQGNEPIVLSRSDGYIGVLIDDLVTKETKEPYRMMTSRAEYRLLLRQDNADLRLTDIGHEVGLIDDERYAKFCRKRDIIHSEIDRLKNVMIGANKNTQRFLSNHESSPIHTAVSLADLIRRPELGYEAVAELDPERPDFGTVADEAAMPETEDSHNNVTSTSLDREIIEQIDISLKYEGYIDRQMRQVEHFKKMEVKKIPADIDYGNVRNLRIEARQKLEQIRPESIGQASRISGVSPADVNMLMLYLNM
jgi:tRNA uridine 5-carboxymethylaminomethyl modification enzyme